jgi:tRNA (guanine37-N1)-methyltransferase
MTHRFTILTLFPELFDSFLSASLIGKSIEAGTLAVDRIDIRDFATDRHNSVDDAPFGGGAGMVLMPGPAIAALRAAPAGLRIMLTPQGRRLTQAIAAELAAHDVITVLCGRYEGFDERIRDHVDMEISIGDFVLNGGEVAAMALVEAIARLDESTLGNPDSTKEESYTDGLLEYPQYTRPREFEGSSVPDVLLSGNHAEIEGWRLRQRLARTLARRPDLLEHADLTDEDREYLATLADD